MKKHNEFLELLNKDSKSLKDISEIDKEVNSDDNKKKIAMIYNKLENHCAIESHLPVDLISKYVLFINNQDTEPEIVSSIPKIDTHLNECSICMTIFNSFKNEYEETKQFVTEKFTVEKSAIFFVPRTVRYSAAGVFAVLLLFVIVLEGINLSTPSYMKLAGLSSEQEFTYNRGRTSEYFQKSLVYLDNKDYENAVLMLQKDIVENKNEKTIFYSYYVAGITSLLNAESNFMNLLSVYDKNYSEKGIRFLEKSIELNTSGRFENLKFDAYYFIGKGYLMLDKPSIALIYFDKVVSGKGGKYFEAKKLKQLIDYDK